MHESFFSLRRGERYYETFVMPSTKHHGKRTVLHVLPFAAGVDVVLGPLVTLLIANPRETRRTLARGIAVIVVVQLVALSCGCMALCAVFLGGAAQDSQTAPARKKIRRRTQRREGVTSCARRRSD